MKKAFFLVLIFFVLLLVLVTCTAFFSMLEDVTLRMEAGQKVSFLNKAYFIDGVINFLPWCAVGALLMLIFYIIKHRFTVLQFIVSYFVLALLVWLLLLPGFCHIYDNYGYGSTDRTTAVRKTEPVSGGYFREKGDFLTYRTGDSEVEGSVWRRKLYNVSDVDSGSVHADPLIEKTVKMPAWYSFAQRSCRIIRDAALSALDAGYPSYLLFATMGLALSSLIFLYRMSGWRLVNAVVVTVGFVTVLYVNSLFHDPEAVAAAPFLGFWWMPLAVNVTVTVILMTAGIVNWVRIPDRNREDA